VDQVEVFQSCNQLLEADGVRIHPHSDVSGESNLLRNSCTSPVLVLNDAFIQAVLVPVHKTPVVVARCPPFLYDAKKRHYGRWHQSKPGVDMRCLREDLAHLCNLMVSFKRIGLVN
jgi:hypothetical protein